jgi:hypothetical protein
MNATLAKTVTLVDSMSDFRDKKRAELDFDIVVNPLGIFIHPYGYGEKEAANDKGFPIMIELHEGEPVVRVWNDIDSEEGVVIGLRGAKESLRKK